MAVPRVGSLGAKVRVRALIETEAISARARRSLNRIAAIEHEIGAVDHRRGVARQEERSLGHLARLSKAPRRDRRPRLVALFAPQFARPSSVSTTVGEMQLAVTPKGPHSSAMTLVMPISPALLAL